VTRTMDRAGIRRESPTRLDGARRAGGRVAWAVVTALALAFLAASIPSRFNELRTVCGGANCALAQLSPDAARALRDLGLSVAMVADYVTSVEVALPLVFVAAGAVIYWRKADDWVTLYVSGTLVVLGVSAWPLFDALARAHSMWRLPIDSLRAVGLGALMLLGFIFPNGHFVPRWSRPLSVLLAVWTVALALRLLPYASLPWLASLMIWIGVGALAQIYRYRWVSGPVERQQTKWVVLGISATFLGLVFGALLPPILFPGVFSSLDAPMTGGPDLFFRLIYLPLVAFGAVSLTPLAIAFAVLRHRLWEVDPIVNRALIYGLLSIALALGYGIGVVGIQAALHAFGIASSDLALIASTLAIAGLFQPMRGRIQQTIDRRFYRRKYDATRILAESGAMLGKEVELSRLIERLIDVVEDTMQPEHVSVWLRGKGSDRAESRVLTTQ
jgi:hypothetical protein